jgi:hypothetical protein
VNNSQKSEEKEFYSFTSSIVAVAAFFLYTYNPVHAGRFGAV